MKAVIVEIRGNTVIMLSNDGSFIKRKNKNYEIGQEVEINMIKTFKSKRTLLVAAIVSCLMLVFGGTAYAYFTPTEYISLDVNPSIEYSINTFNRVLSVVGVNDDGNTIVNSLEVNTLKNKDINDAISLTLTQIIKSDYLNNPENAVVITTSSNDSVKAIELAKDLKNTADATCKENDCDAVVNAEAVGAERVSQAKELGVTPGKLNLVEKLIKSSPDSTSINKDEWLNKSVKDIMAQTKENKEYEKNVNESQNNEDLQQNQEEIRNMESNQNSNQSTTQSNTGNHETLQNPSPPDTNSSENNNKQNNPTSNENSNTSNDAVNNSPSSNDNGSSSNNTNNSNNGNSKK